MDNVPVYDTPRFPFLPWLLAWSRKFWSLSGRIFYSLLTLCALAGVWMLAYWNFLKV